MKKIITFIIGMIVGMLIAMAMPKIKAYSIAHTHYGHYEEYHSRADLDTHCIWVWDCEPYCNGEHDNIEH